MSKKYFELLYIKINKEGAKEKGKWKIKNRKKDCLKYNVSQILIIIKLFLSGQIQRNLNYYDPPSFDLFYSYIV